MGTFRFRRFEVENERSPLKVGTDGVLLGAAVTLPSGCGRVLDIGTGTGVIALMLAQRSEADSPRIEGIDSDADAVMEAEANFAGSPWAERLTARHIALQAFTPEEDFDLIVSNPPYFEGSLLNPDARKAAARHAGGLSLTDICSFAASHLRREGVLSLILPSEEETRLIRTAASFGLHATRLLKVRTTPAKRVSRIIAEFSPVGRGPAKEEALTLLDEKGRRSDGYASLTGEFYL